MPVELQDQDHEWQEVPTVSEVGGLIGFRGRFAKATEPTAVEIPEGDWGFWRDTSKTPARFYFVCREGGRLSRVQMAPIG